MISSGRVIIHQTAQCVDLIMSLEREINQAVQMMFRHAKSVVSRNLTNAVRRGDITIDVSKLPGLDLIIGRSIDDAFVQSSKQVSETLRAAIKEGRIVEKK
jgi:hypothetical protein